MVMLDVNDPELTSFELDLGAATLTLIWSKPVIATTIQVQQITIQESATGGGSITNSEVSDPESRAVIVINLGIQTADDLKRRTDVATSIATTYISMPMGVAEDALQNRPSEEIPNNAALPASAFSPDVLPPDIVMFRLDLNTGELTLRFDEYIGTFDPNGLIILNDPVSPTANHTLFNSTIQSQVDDLVIVELGPSDLDGIMSQPGLATNPSTTFLALSPGSVTDQDGANVSVTTIFAVTGVVNADVENPQLLSFSIDLSTEILSLTFDEVIDPDSVYLPGLTLQSMNSTNSPFSYQLTPSSHVLTPRGRVLDIHLIGNDASAIKADDMLATMQSNTWLSLNLSFASDYSGNAVTPIEALNAASVISDTSRPRLLQFTIDLSNSVIFLTFSEAISIGTFDPQEITLFSDPSGAGINLTLSGGFYPQISAAVIELSPVAADIIFLKEQSRLGLFGSSPLNTYISLTENTANDTSGNRVVPIPLNASHSAFDVLPDSRGPVVVAFTLDINSAILTLHFDEIVNSTTFNATLITLHGANLDNSSNYTLTTTAPMQMLSGDGTVLTFYLSEDDLNGVKGAEICNTTVDCYLSYVDGLIADELGNIAELQPVSNAPQSIAVGMDFNSPELVELPCLILMLVPLV